MKIKTKIRIKNINKKIKNKSNIKLHLLCDSNIIYVYQQRR